MRPEMPLAFEVRPKVTAEASEPAEAAVTPRLALVPASRLPTVPTVSLAFEELAATSRLSW